MTNPIRHDFQNCYVLEFPDEHRVETYYQDGTVAYAVPHDSDEYRATARDLGYGDDVWSLTREHELFHTLIAELRGEHHSGALWAQAHKDEGVELDPRSMPVRGQEEEARLFEFQRFLNRVRPRC